MGSRLRSNSSRRGRTSGKRYSGGREAVHEAVKASDDDDEEEEEEEEEEDDDDFEEDYEDVSDHGEYSDEEQPNERLKNSVADDNHSDDDEVMLKQFVRASAK